MLLAHNRRFPSARLFSTLAGFVEPGESLEEAVAREVREETGVRVRAVRYHSSQPWPFPSSIMIGFIAETDDSTLVLDAEEIVEARWFSRAELREPDRVGIRLPRPDSIARRLILDWVDGEAACVG
ncbi:MAG: NAD(+) diphosphatase [Acetobacteraceae bacterium]|nr:NAD(+) diphosphatase [Acetobacteraceae bacterium]